MSTHFYPRASTSAPQTPARPGSSRPTIRAITPSPPRSLSGATVRGHEESEKPHRAFPWAREQQSMPSEREQTSQACAHGFEDAKIETVHRTSTAQGIWGFEGEKREEDQKDRLREPSDGHGARLRRGGMPADRRSPVKRRGRNRSHRTRPYSSPKTMSSRYKMPSDHPTGGQEDDKGGSQKPQDDNHSDISADCPDTPTPMTASQKKFAYLPLGTPAPIAYPKGSSKPTSSPYATPIVANPAATSSAGPSPDASPSAASIQLPNPQIQHTEQRPNPDAHHEPIPQAKDAAQAPAYTVPRKPISSPLAPTSLVHRAVSRSDASNMSIGTAQSRHSVFSTPGRDEMERKKALVEVDEGPFGNAASVAELNESRRVISTRAERTLGRGAAGGSDGRGKKDRVCGIKGVCRVM